MKPYMVTSSDTISASLVHVVQVTYGTTLVHTFKNDEPQFRKAPYQ